MKLHFKLTHDEISDAYGLVQEKSEGKFNCFWTGVGIFHDVFEHWFEENHKYFKGKFAHNWVGEVAAMGACVYYYYTLGVYERMDNTRDNVYTDKENIILTVHGHVEDIVKYHSHAEFGEEFLCDIPYQKPTGCIDLEDIILSHWDKVRELDTNWNGATKRNKFLKSITFKKLANAYRWGYRTAKRLAPNNNQNRRTLTDFLLYWEDFTKTNEARHLAGMYDGIDFKLSKNSGAITWQAELISNYDSEFNVILQEHFNPQVTYG